MKSLMTVATIAVGSSLALPASAQTPTPRDPGQTSPLAARDAGQTSPLAARYTGQSSPLAAKDTWQEVAFGEESGPGVAAGEAEHRQRRRR